MVIVSWSWGGGSSRRLEWGVHLRIKALVWGNGPFTAGSHLDSTLVFCWVILVVLIFHRRRSLTHNIVDSILIDPFLKTDLVAACQEIRLRGAIPRPQIITVAAVREFHHGTVAVAETLFGWWLIVPDLKHHLRSRNIGVQDVFRDY